MDSYDVRFWDIKKIGRRRRRQAVHRSRWAVDGREHCKSFKARPLADGFLDGLKDAVRDRRPFSPRTGLPGTEATEGEMVTWYAHARAYAEAKWGGLAPVSRRSVAEALVTVTIALSAQGAGAPPEARVLRQALFALERSTPPPATPSPPPRDRRQPSAGPPAPRCPVARAGRPGARCGSRWPPAPRPWYKHAGRRVDTAAQAVGVLQRPRLRRRAGPPGIQPGRPHPVDRPGRRARASVRQGRRQPRPRPRTLLAAVARTRRTGARTWRRSTAALYYAALRPSGGGHAPRGRTCTCPRPDGGRIVLAASASRAGTAPGPTAAPPAQERGLKHRADNRDPHHPHPARPRPAARRPHRQVRHRPGRPDLPDRPGRASSRTPAIHDPGLGRGPPGERSPRRSTGRRWAAARMTCGTRRCRCG